MGKLDWTRAKREARSLGGSVRATEGCAFAFQSASPGCACRDWLSALRSPECSNGALLDYRLVLARSPDSRRAGAPPHWWRTGPSPGCSVSDPMARGRRPAGRSATVRPSAGRRGGIPVCALVRCSSAFALEQHLQAQPFAASRLLRLMSACSSTATDCAVASTASRLRRPEALEKKCAPRARRGTTAPRQDRQLPHGEPSEVSAIVGTFAWNFCKKSEALSAPCSRSASCYSCARSTRARAASPPRWGDGQVVLPNGVLGRGLAVVGPDGERFARKPRPLCRTRAGRGVDRTLPPQQRGNPLPERGFSFATASISVWKALECHSLRSRATEVNCTIRIRRWSACATANRPSRVLLGSVMFPPS